MERCIVAAVFGGLSNRLKTIISAHRIARETGRVLYVHWAPELWWNADGHARTLPWPGGWNDLFAQPVKTISQRKIQQLWSTPGNGLQEWEHHVIPRDDTRPAILKTGWRWIRYEDEPDVDFLAPPHVTEAQKAVARAMQPSMRLARPVPAIQERIDRFATEQGIDQDWVGLHVRTQHYYCRRIGLDQYEALVDAVLDTAPTTRFLLCCDNAEAERRLLARYDERMVAYPKDSHDVVDGLKNGHAVVDMFLLARTGRLIGANGSTYNEFAWWLAGCTVPLQTIRPG